MNAIGKLGVCGFHPFQNMATVMMHHHRERPATTRNLLEVQSAAL
jgi:hypothetical protein